MNIKNNFHTHTTRCLHAEGLDEEYVLTAIKNNYKVLGFSDHAPYKDNRYGYRMQYKELDEYYNSLAILKEKYKNKIEILIGLEIEYNEDVHNYYSELLEKFDYLLLGQHVTPLEEDTIIDNHNFLDNFKLSNTSDYILYARYVEKALNTGYFKMLAHPDLVFLNNLPFDKNCEEAVDIIINAAKKNDTILEINANGIRRKFTDYIDGKRYGYPTHFFWDKVKDTNIKVIIGADAHEPSHLEDKAVDDAYVFARELGLNIVEDFRG